MARKVLVTGITGFTGRYVAAELEKAGHVVCGTSHGAHDASSWPTFACDLLDREQTIEVIARERPDVVVHLAAIAFVAHGDADGMYRTNIVGTRNLLDALVQSTHVPSSVLLASSANIYGNAACETVDETVPPCPANDYAVSKLAMEYMASLWTNKLPVTIVRPFNYTGVGQSAAFLLPKIVDHFRRRAPVIELGNINVVRDFSDVRMVAGAYRKLVEHEIRGQVVNVCSGVGHSLEDVLDTMRALTGHVPEIRINPAFVRSNEVHRLVGSKMRLETLVGPLNAIPLQDTLSWMLEHDE
ncbi:NAD-dependent epimerase/dehydratase family protein [Burkholderia cepacia]|uniref:NAD-dependent epimerase/dehydratase family protein n=1 Tax=Burkholderia cepacia TaxID=292 RepID=UPI000754012E|nr:NAD-dependent epimerase/dehydratase family protein [Burkholderia cepacia]KVW90754.1 GDP-mannose 4,6 dehydratase [Burkholderia cepacia]KVX63337.1 GDP-mannose 4,6 dehydratase [Burkholderia cepacia]